MHVPAHGTFVAVCSARSTSTIASGLRLSTDEDVRIHGGVRGPWRRSPSTTPASWSRSMAESQEGISSWPRASEVEELATAKLEDAPRRADSRARGHPPRRGHAPSSAARSRRVQSQLRQHHRRVLGAAAQGLHDDRPPAWPPTIPVLIEGESGTGKELVARAIHFSWSRAQGARRSSPSTAAPSRRTLLESELFGHVRGAFTECHQPTRRGSSRWRHSGTLLLDELGELPLEMQVKLLPRAPELVTSRRSAATRVRARVDVRIVAATNRQAATRRYSRRALSRGSVLSTLGRADPHPAAA
jgi:transcriptional regulator with AAA-type ATPase domain